MSTFLIAAVVAIVTSVGWIWYFVFSHKSNAQLDDSLFAVQKKAKVRTLVDSL
jgi:hypothetical protein